MRQKFLLAACLSATVQAQASEIDNLINASQDIRDTFKYGIQAIAGAESYSWQGLITPDNTVDQGLLDKAKQDAYNAAVLAVQNQTYTYDPNSQQYFEDQATTAMDVVSETIDAYVQAAQVLIEVATINEMAQDAAEAQDDRQAMALQEYIAANDVTLEDQEVDQYNDALVAVHEATQVAAAYMAVANDESLLEQADDMAFDLRVTYQEAASVFFDAATQSVWISFDGGTTIQGLSLANYYVTIEDVLTEGEQQPFYRTSPEGGCWFAADPEACYDDIYGD
jgi:hypothetical protein